MSEHAHRANRNNPLIGRRQSKGTSFDEKTMQPRYCLCPTCGTRTLAKVGIDCGSVPCIKCGEHMVDQ